MVVDVKRNLKWFIEKMVTTHQTDEKPYIVFPEQDKISEEIAFEVIKRSYISTGNEILRVPPIDLGSNYLIFPRVVDEQSIIITGTTDIVNTVNKNGIYEKADYHGKKNSWKKIKLLIKGKKLWIIPCLLILIQQQEELE